MQSLSKFISESIFSQTGMGDDGIIRRNLPLKILDCIISFLESSKYRINDVRMTDQTIAYLNKHVKISIDLDQFNLRDSDQLNSYGELKKNTSLLLHIQEKLYSDIVKYVKKDDSICRHITFTTDPEAITNTADSEMVEFIVYSIFPKTMEMEVLMRGKFLDENRKDISTILKRLKKNGWNGKITKEHLP